MACFRNVCQKDLDASAAAVCGYGHGREADILEGEKSLLSNNFENIRQNLMKFWQGEVLWDCPMKRFSTLRVGGPATAVVLPTSAAEVSRLVKGLQRYAIPWRVIGRGSNILVPDAGFSGVVIVLGPQFSKIGKTQELGERTKVPVESGCGLAKLCNWCIDRRLTGLEFATGIPGSVGGAVSMNAGAWGEEISEVVAAITFIDSHGEVFTRSRQTLRFSYRHLAREEGTIILSAVFELRKGSREEIASTCRKYMKQRKENQPHGAASAGSFFKNPAGYEAAGFLIEQAGLKGFRVGGAMVSDVHANFIVNTGEATARNFLELMRVVQEKVLDNSGICLEPEVDIWIALEN